MDQIDKLERTKYDMQIRFQWEEKFMYPLSLALLLLMFELFLRLYLLPILPE